MDKTRKTNEKDIEKWLISFEKQIGKPCVVSLLIEKGDIDFLACWDKKRYMHLEDEADSADDSEPTIDFEKAKKEVKKTALNVHDYIG